VPDKICAKTCTECALSTNSPFDDETKALVLKANEAGIIFNCHWPEKREGDTEATVRMRMGYGGSSMPLCHTSVEILKARLRRGLFSPNLAANCEKMIAQAAIVETHDADSMRALLDPGDSFNCTIDATLGFMKVPGKPIFVSRPAIIINEGAD
jgi:hypothetical protein